MLMIKFILGTLTADNLIPLKLHAKTGEREREIFTVRVKLFFNFVN